MGVDSTQGSIFCNQLTAQIDIAGAGVNSPLLGVGVQQLPGLAVNTGAVVDTGAQTRTEDPAAQRVIGVAGVASPHGAAGAGDPGLTAPTEY